MKGFAKIFEAIIASIILLASLTFFFVPHVAESEWDDTNLQIMAQDALEAVYYNGSLTRFVKTDNSTPLIASISGMLPKTVDFSIHVRGIPNRIIYIACGDCTQIQKNELLAIINTTDFKYGGRNISVRVENLTMSEEIPEDTDILFFFDKSKISTYKSRINSFMTDGGSVFLLSDLVQSDVDGDIGKIFNLSWGGFGGQLGQFDDVYNSSKLSHYVAKYYANTTGRDLSGVTGEGFTFDTSGVRHDKSAVFGGNVAFVHGHYNNSVRTVWFSDYNRNNHENIQTRRTDNLTKAAIMWASGESFILTQKKEPAKVNFRSSIFVHDGDSYVVELTVWRIFF